MPRVSPYIEDVLALPPRDQLLYALEIIRSLTEVSDEALTRYADDYGLTGTEAAVLDFIVMRAGKPAAKTAIYDAVWGPLAEGDPKAIDVFIHRIRGKLPDGKVIRVIWGLGYTISPEDAKQFTRPEVPSSEIPAVPTAL